MALTRMLACCALALGLAGMARAQDRNADHEELRALKAACVEAINTRDFAKIAPLLAQEFTVVTVDNQKFTQLEDFAKYFEGLLTGSGAPLEKIEVKAEADDLTRFLGADTGMAFGTSEDTYHFKGGDVRTMKTRWSAVVKKEDRWKLASVHFSASFLDNPLIEAAKTYALHGMLGAGAAGLVVGVLLARLLGRSRRAA